LRWKIQRHAAPGLPSNETHHEREPVAPHLIITRSQAILKALICKTMTTTDMSQKITCIIDDDEIYLFSVKKVIEMNKLSDKVLDFKNGSEAMDFFTRYRDNDELLPDVIFLDINMPVMDGWEFIEAFRKIQPSIGKEITLYLVSSSVDKRDVDKAKGLPNVHDYITKPITATELKRIYGAVA
jgi:CheY-like chemotaxis protein